MLLQIKRKIKQQPDTKSAVEIMFQHMVDHVKHVFRRRKYMVRRSVDFLCFCFQIFSGKDFIDQLVRRFILIYSNHTVMQLQKKAAVLSFRMYSDKWYDGHKVLLRPDSRSYAESVQHAENLFCH